MRSEAWDYFLLCRDTMARPRANGKTQQGNRLRVLACLEMDPKLSSKEIERRAGVPVSTIRGIRKKWGGRPLDLKNMADKRRKGRPQKRSKRWMRCARIKIERTHIKSLCSGNWHA